MTKIDAKVNPGLSEKVDAYIAENQDKIISALQDLLKIPSVKTAPEKNAPFGKGVRDALDHTLNLARELGFETIDMDGYIGCVDYGFQGNEDKELLAIMCHLDVVPEGIGWDHPPFAAEIADGKLFARGALDDKGPTISALYALAAIKAAGLRLKRRVRILLGCDEESGWGCMDHYSEHGETPHMAFSPDADYPLVNSEKGILHASFKREFKSNISLESGSRPNVIPNDARITLKAADFELEDIVKAASSVEEAGFPTDYSLEDDEITITVTGLGGHAASPEMGKNALLAALTVLSALPLEGDDREVVETLHNALMQDLHAEHLGLDVNDESGRTTINPGVMRWDKDGIHEFSVDMRCPRTLNLEDTLEKLKTAFSKAGLTHTGGELKDGHFVPRESELVSKLLSVYEKRTGEAAEPLAIGGGTYARAIENAVAFGCERPGVEAPIHMPNEFIRLEDIMFNTYLIADAIIALACEE